MRGGTRECLPGSPCIGPNGALGGLVGPLDGTPLPSGGGAYRSVLHLGGLTMLAPPPHLAYQTVGCYGG